jgi:BirA family biotin operon repressor/biotin-[acetyl-CoA-carboxylase] ligase
VDMDQSSLEAKLADLNLPSIRFYDSTGSTNDEAWLWLDAGAPHCALVVADTQTSGRGRFHRHWVTVSKSGLAFSILLLFPPLKQQYVNRLIGLGALAVCKTLQNTYHLPSSIKWPNDILLNRGKVAGVLVETRWQGEQLMAANMGIGINIAPPSINPVNLPPDGFIYPATCVENELGDKVNRLELLHDVLNTLLNLLPELPSVNIMNMWEGSLAFLNQWVELSDDRTIYHSKLDALSTKVQVAKAIGLEPDGSLKLLTKSGDVLKVPVGEIHINPLSGKP